MDKPISLMVRDFKMNLAKTISEAGLPPCIIEPIMINVLFEVQRQNEMQTQADSKSFVDELTEHKEA